MGRWQSLWSRILAGEANTPGTYSKRTVNFVSELDKIDADLFTMLCRFSWTIEDTFEPMVFEHQEEIYNKHRINFDSLVHLESIRLIRFAATSDFRWVELPKRIVLNYYGKSLRLNMPQGFRQ